MMVIFKEWDIRKDKIEIIRENCYQELLNNEIYLHQEDEDYISEQEKLTEEIKKEFG